MKYGERDRPPKVSYENEDRESHVSRSDNFVLYFSVPGFKGGHSDNRPVFSELDFHFTAASNDTDVETARHAKEKFFAAVVQFDPEDRKQLKSFTLLRDLFYDLRIIGLVPNERWGDTVSPVLAELVRTGALFDVQSLPADEECLGFMLRRMQGLAAAERNTDPPDGDPIDEPYMIGASSPMLDTYAKIRKYAPIDAPVLITGETGTGKEVAARAIHERSEYRDGPFVPINCAALPPTLIAAELFGHEKGTFTGAHQRKIGRIEAAHRGTLFLDEIGDMPLQDQIHLLRFLQDKMIERLGSTKAIHVDARIIVATNADLDAAVREERFREDLFYRLNVLTLALPPLRDRGEDIELIGRYYLEQFARDHRRRNLRFSRGALVAMMNHPWPGNVRELISTVRRGAVFAENGVVTPEALGLDEPAARGAVSMQTLAEAKADLERKLVSKALRKNGNVVQHAAQDLGISRVALYRLMKKVGTRSGAHRTDPSGSALRSSWPPSGQTMADHSRRQRQN